MASRSPVLATRIAQAPIVAAAAGVFARLGFGAARVEDILEAAGIARRTFYKHFRSKEEVLAALYELATSELLKVVVARMPERADPLHAVRAGLDLYLEYHVENAALLKVLVEQALQSDSPLAAGRQRFRRELVRVLDEAVQAHTGETHDPMLYIALVSALEGLSLDLLATRAGAGEVARAKRVMHSLLDGIVRSRA